MHLQAFVAGEVKSTAVSFLLYWKSVYYYSCESRKYKTIYELYVDDKLIEINKEIQ